MGGLNILQLSARNRNKNAIDPTQIFPITSSDRLHGKVSMQTGGSMPAKDKFANVTGHSGLAKKYMKLV